MARDLHVHLGNVSKDVAMARVKCPQCGASIEKGSKFCAHCGTQIPDDVQKADIHITDDAELKRAAYETEESRLRQKKMKQELRRGKAKKIAALTLAGIGLAIVLIGFIINDFFWFVPGMLLMGFGIGLWIIDLFG